MAPDAALYPTPARRRRAVLAWCLFDFANSSFTNLILMLAFPIFFREVVVHASGNAADRLWGLAHFIAMLAVVLVSPLVGALADASGRKKRLLILATLQAVGATALLSTAGTGDVAWAMFLFIVATIGFEIGVVVYNAFLVDIATPESLGRVSGWGWGLGFPGGLAAVALCYPWIRPDLRGPDGVLVAAAVGGRQTSFLIVAAFFLVFALPAFAWLRDAPRASAPRLPLLEQVRDSFRRVADTLRHLRRYRETAKFILAAVFYNDGITTILVFSAIYASVTFDFSSAEIIRLFLLLNVFAFPGAVLAGYLADAIGARRTLLLSLGLWIAVVLLAWLATSKTAFWIMATGAAIGMGSTQAVGRSFMAEITPEARQAEFFGFYVLAGKVASMFGPLVFGLVSSTTGDQRLAVLSLLPMFVIGALLLAAVNERKARQVAAACATGSPLGS